MGKHPAWLGKAMQSGGSAWTGEGDSGKKLREDAIASSADTSKGSALSGAAIGIGTGLMAGAGPKGKLIGAGITAAGLPSAVRFLKGEAKAHAMEKAADKAEGRKRGGRAMQSGGRAWSGEGDSGKELKEKSAAEDAQAVHGLKVGTAKSLVGGALTGLSRGIVGKGLGIGAGISGVNDISDALGRSAKARRMNDAADKAEGRKRGGRASKKKD